MKRIILATALLLAWGSASAQEQFDERRYIVVPATAQTLDHDQAKALARDLHQQGKGAHIIALVVGETSDGVEIDWRRYEPRKAGQ